MAKTYYEILGVASDATLADINEAYSEKVFKTESVRTAYETLINVEKRKQYDKQLEDAEKQPTHYDTLNVAPNITQDELLDMYSKLSDRDKQKPEIQEAYSVLMKPKQRSKYNIKIGKIKLKKDTKHKLKDDICDVLSNGHDNYTREIYIKRYENKIALLNEQIEMVQAQKQTDKDRFFYRRNLLYLIEQRDRAQRELERWLLGRGLNVADLKGKGLKSTFVSKVLKTSQAQIEKNKQEIKSSDTGIIKKGGLILYNAVVLKTLRNLSSGGIKLYSSAWSAMQNVTLKVTSLRMPYGNLFISETQFDDFVDNSIYKTI